VAKDASRAVLVVTHDHRTLSYADRLIRIEDGRIVGRARKRAAPKNLPSQSQPVA
jgi:putative ABC transport system ATP-binding protein